MPDAMKPSGGPMDPGFRQDGGRAILRSCRAVWPEEDEGIGEPMRTLKMADAATADIDSIRRWLRQPGAGPRAARRYQHIRTAVRELRAAPCRWRYSDEHDGCRERVVENYRIVYRIDPDTGDNRTAGNIVVLRIFGPGQLGNQL